jgi:Phage integrase SAM-like domain
MPTTKLLEFLGPAPELDLTSVTRRALVEFRNQVAQKASATTTNHDLKPIKALFREAKRDGYITEDPSEFVDTVRKNSEDSKRPFTVPEIRSQRFKVCLRSPTQNGKAWFCSACIPVNAWPTLHHLPGTTSIWEETRSGYGAEKPVTFRTSLGGRSTRSVGRESFGIKRSVRVQATTKSA